MENTEQKGGMDFFMGSSEINSIEIDRFISVLKERLINETIDKNTKQITKDGRQRLDLYYDAIENIDNYQKLINTDSHNIQENYKQFSELSIMKYIKSIINRKEEYKKKHIECNTELEDLTNEYQSVRKDFDEIVKNTEYFSDFLKKF